MGGVTNEPSMEDILSSIKKIIAEDTAKPQGFTRARARPVETQPVDAEPEPEVDDVEQRRADRVLRYLVTKHEFPVYRIYNVGLGEDKLADEGKGREARAKNRRVEIRLYTAGEAAQQKQATPSPSARNNNPSN